MKALPDVFVPFVTDLGENELDALISSFHRFVEQVEADCVAEEGQEAVEAEEEGDGDKEGVPEPEHQVDFLVDDVLKKGLKKGLWKT